jgi:hypothetical protein
VQEKKEKTKYIQYQKEMENVKEKPTISAKS